MSILLLSLDYLVTYKCNKVIIGDKGFIRFTYFVIVLGGATVPKTALVPCFSSLKLEFL